MYAKDRPGEREKENSKENSRECWNLTQWRRLSLRDRGGGSGYGNNYVEFEQQFEATNDC